MVVKLFVKYTIMPLMQKSLNAFPSGLLKLRLGLRDQTMLQKHFAVNLQCCYVAVEDSCNICNHFMLYGMKEIKYERRKLRSELLCCMGTDDDTYQY
ncbi:hypothetical protein X777_08561 [Ooceraea biroi]|uniref:Uncharacterized protein n=1 Tax=Ooceraea biroi TaxID=2015173 RepID=A0A026W8V8_OOCBI|nr:hypothetical protein X777_08561 [Ooceraea biroi]